MPSHKTSPFTWLVLGIIVASAAAGGLHGLFVGLVQTQDWVLEYVTWIDAGIWVVGIAILSAFVAVPMWLSRRSKRNV